MATINNSSETVITEVFNLAEFKAKFNIEKLNFGQPKETTLANGTKTKCCMANTKIGDEPCVVFWGLDNLTDFSKNNGKSEDVTVWMDPSRPDANGNPRPGFQASCYWEKTFMSI